MGNYARGEFKPKNPEKYMGKHPIIFRSGWEFSAMRAFDEWPEIIGWCSETISIPYRNPCTGRPSMYVPDFLVVYQDKNGKQHCELMEVKPAKESPLFEGRVSQRTKLAQAINAAKWQAAMVFCAKRNWTFRVLTERELFGIKK